MMAWLASFGAGLINAAALLAIFSGSIGLTIWLGKHAPSSFGKLGEKARWFIGFFVWLALLIAAFMVFGPALNQLQKFACRDARNFDLCMNPPEREWF